MIPQTEYLSFVDNGVFSVDGVLSDLPVTASAIIEKLLIITSEGASGDYPAPGCTDMAYTKAVPDGADVLDYPVQMTNDGIKIADVVQKLQSSNLSVYVQRFNNEFVSQAWDFFSDSSVEKT
ncbi:hypothetical protein KY289_012848 [Solanum tuberosum]|nr:hypothetical protein KY289_012848 [Solanum tuberosum]